MEHTPGGPSNHPPHLHHEPSEQLHPLAESGDHLEKFAHSIEELAHQSVDQAKEAEETKKKFLRAIKIDAYLIPLITVAGVALSIGASTYWNSVQQRHARVYEQVNEIKEEIKGEFVIRNQLMDAMTQVRSIREIGQSECKNGKYDGKDKVAYQQKLYSSLFNLVTAYFYVTGVFEQEIKNKILGFLSLADVTEIDKGLCGVIAVKDKDLRALQVSINYLILHEIEKLRIKKGQLEDEVKK